MIWIVLTLLIIIADQATKILISLNANVGDVLFTLPGFKIVYVQNTGAAFSLLSGRVSLLSIISLLFSIGITIYWIKKRPSHPLYCLSLSLLLAGGLGNAVDRIFRGYVVDFISATFINFPVFNIADIAIVLGAILMMICAPFLGDKDENNNS